MLLTLATTSKLTQVAMELVVRTVSSEHHGSVDAYTASTGALDLWSWSDHFSTFMNVSHQNYYILHL